jgi:sec-independent protein translocase protein TatA
MLPIFGFISGIGPTELIIVLVLVLILFGAGRLPQVFEQFGRGIRAFRDAQKEEPIDVTRPKEIAEDTTVPMAHEVGTAEMETKKIRNG